VLDSNGAVLFNSLTASGGAQDALRNLFSIAVSEDQKWLAGLMNNNNIVVVPLINGLPDLANRMVVAVGNNTISGRAIAFDAAGNIHYVSSGQGLYRVLAPGGTTWASTVRDGNGEYQFSVGANAIPEPATCALVLLGLIGMLGAVRRR
jgi:hypothetical protein